MIVLSHFQARSWLEARHRGLEHVTSSLDLNMTNASVGIGLDGATLPGNAHLSWQTVGRIADNESACFALDGTEPRPIQTYSDVYARAYSLYPTASAPTMLVSGKPMHRIKGTDPHRDTLSKIRAVAPVFGMVLDTCTGLGYTAIEAAKLAALVTTIELDPAAQEIARQNPWSQPLFGNPRIVQIIGDACDVVVGFETGSFNIIIHDPPMFSLGGELYSSDFYAELYRVLKPKGRVFHYIGNPESSSGASVTRGVVHRLQDAGFRSVAHRPEAFGVVAYR